MQMGTELKRKSKWVVAEREGERVEKDLNISWRAPNV
jgi:hypothetical protein